MKLSGYITVCHIVPEALHSHPVYEYGEPISEIYQDSKSLEGRNMGRLLLFCPSDSHPVPNMNAINTVAEQESHYMSSDWFQESD